MPRRRSAHLRNVLVHGYVEVDDNAVIDYLGRLGDLETRDRSALPAKSFMDAEAPRQFLDTDVLIYAFDTTAGDKHARAVELLDELTATERGALSIQVLQEFFVTVTSKVPAPLQVGEAAEIVSDLGAMTTHAPVARDVVGAIEIHPACDSRSGTR